MNRRKRTLVITLLILLFLVVPPAWITYREYRQASLDHALIEAIKAGDDQKALAALAEGASGEARDTGEPPTFKEILLHLWDRSQLPDNVRADPVQAPPALLLLYFQTYKRNHYNGLDNWGPGPNLAVVRGLLDHGAVVNDRVAEGWWPDCTILDGMTPLICASNCSSLETSRLLLERGADPKADVRGDTPLMNAEDAKTAELLLQHGANIEAVDEYKRTALMYDAQEDRTDVVRVLLEHGAKVGAKDAKGKTALDIARDSLQADPDDPDAHKIAALLRQHGAK